MSQTSSFSLPIGPVHVALEEPVYFHLDVVSKAHDGVFSEVFLDLGEGQVKVALAGRCQFFRFG